MSRLVVAEIIFVLLMVVLPFLLFPVSKVVWLSFDMLFRPQRPEEFRKVREG